AAARMENSPLLEIDSSVNPLRSISSWHDSAVARTGPRAASRSPAAGADARVAGRTPAEALDVGRRVRPRRDAVRGGGAHRAVHGGVVGGVGRLLVRGALAAAARRDRRDALARVRTGRAGSGGRTRRRGGGRLAARVLVHLDAQARRGARDGHGP